MSALPVHDDQIIVSGENVMAEVKLALERVNVNSDTPVTVQVSGNSVVVTPIHDESRAADFKKAMDETKRRYAECLRALAR